MQVNPASGRQTVQDGLDQKFVCFMGLPGAFFQFTSLRRRGFVRMTGIGLRSCAQLRRAGQRCVLKAGVCLLGGCEPCLLYTSPSPRD